MFTWWFWLLSCDKWRIIYNYLFINIHNVIFISRVKKLTISVGLSQFGILLKLHTVFLLGIYDHEPWGLLRIYINILYITWCSYIKDQIQNEIRYRHHTIILLGFNKSCGIIFICLLKLSPSHGMLHNLKVCGSKKTKRLQQDKLKSSKLTYARGRGLHFNNNFQIKKL